MKKLIVLAIALTTITGSAFANNINIINKKALSSFTKTFQDAQNVRWEVKNNLYKVSFETNGKTLFAYYDASGQRVALSRNIPTDQLPLSLYTELKGMFTESWLTDLFEISTNGETVYYATIESASHITILKADGTTGWSVFKKDRKK